MAAPRLSDAQKQELVSRFRDGAGTQELASAYGCSPNTVIRVVRAAIEPSLYEELKRQRGRRSVQGSGPDPALAGQPVSDPTTQERHPAELPLAAESTPAAQPTTAPDGEHGADPVGRPTASIGSDATPGPDEEPGSASDSDAHEAARALAIDDADDFDDFEDDEETEEDGEDQDDADGDPDLHAQTFVEVPVSLNEALDQPLTTARPWCSEELPSSAYMLVDKTVELQALPLSEIPELGRLDAAELELQALVLYSNPRQAKRHCGRTQRVIPVPDVSVLERRASYLLRQGIRRVVVEGALYALPEA